LLSVNTCLENSKMSDNLTKFSGKLFLIVDIILPVT